MSGYPTTIPDAVSFAAKQVVSARLLVQLQVAGLLVGLLLEPVLLLPTHMGLLEPVGLLMFSFVILFKGEENV